MISIRYSWLVIYIFNFLVLDLAAFDYYPIYRIKQVYLPLKKKSDIFSIKNN